MRALVLGSPIAHSLSPALHRAAYASLGLTHSWTYAAAEVDEAGFPGFVAGLRPDVRGLSLTMPLKEVAFTVASPVTERARLAGAINTLVRVQDGLPDGGSGGWSGDNTDIAGIVAALGARSDRGLILGAGATARSALLALAELGVTSVTVAARDASRALSSLGSLAETLDVQLSFMPLVDWWSACDGVSLGVSTLPPSGAAAAVPVDAGRRALTGLRLLDVVYADWPTPLASAAAAAGADVVSGLDMLVHQAVEQVELMTGRRPDPRVLLDAGGAELRDRASARR